MYVEPPLSALRAPYLVSTGSEFFDGKLCNIGPRPVCSTEWRASRPRLGIPKPRLVCRNHMRSPCGFPGALARHTLGSRDCTVQPASSREDGTILQSQAKLEPIQHPSCVQRQWNKLLLLQKWDLYFPSHTYTGLTKSGIDGKNLKGKALISYPIIIFHLQLPVWLPKTPFIPHVIIPTCDGAGEETPLIPLSSLSPCPLLPRPAFRKEVMPSNPSFSPA